MTNTLRTTWITVFSIVAMLMSSYASSSSIMMTNVMMSQMGPNQSACYHSDALADDMVSKYHVVSSKSHAEHTNMDAQVFDSQCYMSPESEDCGDMMGNHCSGSDCCASVCSAVSYPIQAVQTVNPFISSLARFQSVTIGQKVARAQSLLRPPTA
ncbi:hypothetical protein F0259_13790 [Vibrio cyclitrophicus]|uniref:hypothetical protein n=1 Tax=Vibrio cyclitrophicus TaxID=47951 RepID=UPI00148D4A24|nr:hypothetical protein [Vibrio cyclitrophicus]NOH44879.1 hypothetical protein [Vibrio cyclitrophicus]